jgi:hypothetical protein
MEVTSGHPYFQVGVIRAHSRQLDQELSEDMESRVAGMGHSERPKPRKGVPG